eukprot:4302080-Amphidinium_carterae.2
MGILFQKAAIKHWFDVRDDVDDDVCRGNSTKLFDVADDEDVNTEDHKHDDDDVHDNMMLFNMIVLMMYDADHANKHDHQMMTTMIS